jgi:hypothetical protein
VTIPTAAPGYYPDPAGSPSLRWWDGSAWTDQLTPAGYVPAVSMADPFAVFPGTQAGTTILTAPATERSARLATVTVVLGVVVLSLIVGLTGWWARSRPDGPTSNGVVTGAQPLAGATASVPGAAPAPRPPNGVPLPAFPPETRHVAGQPVVTVAEAQLVMKTFWAANEDAVARRDIPKLRTMESGAAALWTVGAVSCYCLHSDHPRGLLEAQYFVSRQTRYPAHFMVEARANEMSGDVGWVDVLVFTKASAHARWLVAEHSGYPQSTDNDVWLGSPVTTGEGFAKPPTAQQQRRARTAARELAALWWQAKKTGRVPSQIRFYDAAAPRELMARFAAYPQDRLQRNGLLGHSVIYIDRADPFVEYNEAGGAIVCQPIRETITYRPPSGHVIRQDLAQNNWGILIAPGLYRSVTYRGAWQTCFRMTADESQPIFILNQDIRGGEPSTT